MSGNTPRITAEERRENESMRGQQKWLAVVIGEGGERKYLPNPSYWRGPFTPHRSKAQRYLSKEAALRNAQQKKDWEWPDKPVNTPRAERLRYPWIADIDAEQVK